MRLFAVLIALLVLLFLTFSFPGFSPAQGEDAVCYWDVQDRPAAERQPLNLIFESPQFARDPAKAAVQMSKYASLMGYDFIGTEEYNEECGIQSYGYWASNTMYGVIDWTPDDPSLVCLRANVNEEFPCFVSWTMPETRDPSTLDARDRLRYLNGTLLSYWIDVQRDDAVDMYISALEEHPGQDLQWDQVGMLYLDEFDSNGYSYVDEDYELTGPSQDSPDFRCHEFHEEGGVDSMGHDYSTPEEGKLVMQARLMDLAHRHGVKVAVGVGGADWFLRFLPFIHGDLPESEWPYSIPLERYRDAEPDYFVIEPDLGDPGTEQFEISNYTYSAAEAYSDRVYAGSPRPHIPEIGVDSEKNIYAVGQVVFRAGYLASKGFWFGPNSETIDAVITDPDTGEMIASKSLLKAIPNWENLNEVPLEDRSWDSLSNVYESPLTYIDAGLAFSRHPFTGELHAVFMDPNAALPFDGNWDDFNVYRTSPIWEKVADAKSELEYANGRVMLRDSSRLQAGYVITRETYELPPQAGGSEGWQPLVQALRIILAAGIVLVLAAYITRRHRGSRAQ